MPVIGYVMFGRGQYAPRRRRRYEVQIVSYARYSDARLGRGDQAHQFGIARPNQGRLGRGVCQ